MVHPSARGRTTAVVVLALIAGWACDGNDDGVAESTARSATASASADASDGVSTISPTTSTTADVESPAATTAPPATTATTAPTTESAPTTSTTTSVAVEVGLAWREIDIVDETRATDEVLGTDGSVLLPASNTRTISTVLLYPGVDGGGEDATVATVETRPLVIWLNGFGGRAGPGDPLLLALYDAGYVVAAPNISELAAPVSFPGGYPKQPGDVSAVIDALLSSDDGVVDDLAAVVDGERIGIAGHSIGGSGVLGVTYHDCCRDERLDAAATFAAPLIDFEGGEFDLAAPPLLAVHGGADGSVTIDQSEMAIDRAGQGLLVVIDGADHFQPVYGNDRPDVLEISEAVLTTFMNVHVAGTAAPADLDAVLAGYDGRAAAR